MICRTCLRRAAGLASRQLNLSSTTTLSQTLAAPFSTTTLRTFSTSLPILNTSSASAEAQPAAAQGAPDLNPVTPGAAAAAAEGEGKKPLSSCPAGTVLKGLNYFKGKNDPVALPDEAYPEWLWRCLEVKKKTNEGEEGVDVGDEFCTFFSFSSPHQPPAPRGGPSRGRAPAPLAWTYQGNQGTGNADHVV